METENAIEALSALAQETRLKICELLSSSGNAGMPAGDISIALGVPQNTLSFHLSHLQRAGLIGVRKQGRFRLYSLKGRFVDELILFLAQTCRARPGNGDQGEA